MAHPYYHAVSSARRFGGTLEDYLAAHEFLDHTKSHVADCRHRLLLHNAWGIFFAARMLGPTFARASDQKTMPLRPILEFHVNEDFGFIPSLKQCLQSLPMHPSLQNDDDLLLHCQRSQASFGGIWEDYLPLHKELNAPRDVLADQRSQRVLHNAWGIALLVRLQGDIWTRPSDGCALPVRPVLEEHVRHDLGHIPSLQESIAGIAIEPWMYHAAQPLSHMQSASF